MRILSIFFGRGGGGGGGGGGAVGGRVGIFFFVHYLRYVYTYV